MPAQKWQQNEHWNERHDSCSGKRRDLDTSVRFKPRKANRQGLGIGTGEYEREEKFVPTQDEAEKSCRQYARRRHRNGNVAESLPSACPVDARCFLEPCHITFEEGNEHPGKKR